MSCKVIIRYFCISHFLKHCTRLRDQQPPHAFHLDAESLQPNIPRGRAGDASNSQGLFPCSAVLYLLYSLVWLISDFPIYAAFWCWFHPVVSAWQRLVDPPDRREDQTWWSWWVRLPVCSPAKSSKSRNFLRVIDNYVQFDSDYVIVHR